MYAIIKCVRLHISEMCGKLQFLKNQIDFIPLIFLGNSHILIAQVLHHHSLENCAFILWLRNKKYATSLIKSDNNWRSGDDCMPSKEWGNQKLSRRRAKMTLQLFWVSFLWSFYYFVWNANSQNARHTRIPTQAQKQNWKPTTVEFIACHFDWSCSLAPASHPN